MRLAVLGSPQSWYLRDLIRAAGTRHTVHSAAFSRVSATAGFAAGTSSLGERISSISICDPQKPGLASRNEESRIVLNEWDAILVRTMPPGSLEQVVFRMDALQRLEASGKLVVNPPRAIEVAVDKYLALVRMQEADLLVPRTIVCQTADEGMAAFEELKDIVVKPLFGAEGRGITRIQDEALAYRAFTMLERLGAVLYVQEFVPHHGYDLRLFVLGSEVLGMKRMSSTDWRTNVSRGASTLPIEITSALREQALIAAGSTGAVIAGVDLLPGVDGKLYAIEVNAVPGWKALARTLNVDIAQRVLSHLEQML